MLSERFPTSVLSLAFVAVVVLALVLGVTLGGGGGGSGTLGDARPTTGENGDGDRSSTEAERDADESDGSDETRTENETDGDPEGSAQTVSTHTFGEGANEATVYVIESENPGPTAVVVGGVHGNEPAGFHAARDVADWEIDAGTLVVVPEAHAGAVGNGTRHYDGVDLNKQFHAGEEPKTPHARALWAEIESHDPDVVIDLHSSLGIYNSSVTDGRGVGQAIFPTATGDAVEHSERVVREMNREHVPESMPAHRFERGNTLGPYGQILIRKVTADLGVSGYLVETSKHETDRETRVEWTTAIVEKLLERHGLLES